MRITRFLLLTTLLTVIGPNSIFAQEKLIKSDFPTGDYESLLKKKLLSEKMTWGYVFAPSFGQEHSIVCVYQHDKNLLIYNHPDISIYSDIEEQMCVEKDTVPLISGGVFMVPSGLKFNEAEIHAKISSDTLIIEKSLADSLNSLMKQIIDDAITEEISPTIGDGIYVVSEAHLDGDTHLFLYQGKVAKCWSPDIGTYCGRLVFMMDFIRKAIIKKDTSQVSLWVNN